MKRVTVLLGLLILVTVLACDRGENRRDGEIEDPTLRARNRVALNLLRQGKYEEAAEACRKLLQDAPRSPYVYKNLGLALAKHQKDSEGAIAAYERAIALKPDLGDAHNDLGVLHMIRRNYDRAGIELARALEVDPRNRLYLYNLGALHAERGDLEAASRSFREYIRIAPSSSLGYYCMGVIASKMADHEEAIGYLRRTIDIDSLHTSARYVLGKSLMSLGRHEEAARQFEWVVGLQPDHQNARYALSQVYRRMGRMEAAEREMEAFRHLDDVVRPIRIKYAFLSSAEEGTIPDELEEAYSYRERRGEYIRPAEMYYESGVARAKRKEFPRAMESFKMAIRKDPEHAAAHGALGALYERGGMIDEAIREFSKVIEIEGDSSEIGVHARMTLARIADKRGNLQQAIAHMKKAVEAVPDHAFAYMVFAQLYLKHNVHLDEALRLAQKAADLARTPATLTTLARVYYQSGDHVEAQKIRHEISQMVKQMKQGE